MAFLLDSMMTKTLKGLGAIGNISRVLEEAGMVFSFSPFVLFTGYIVFCHFPFLPPMLPGFEHVFPHCWLPSGQGPGQ